MLSSKEYPLMHTRTMKNEKHPSSPGTYGRANKDRVKNEKCPPTSTG